MGFSEPDLLELCVRDMLTRGHMFLSVVECAHAQGEHKCKMGSRGIWACACVDPSPWGWRSAFIWVRRHAKCLLDSSFQGEKGK